MKKPFSLIIALLCAYSLLCVEQTAQAMEEDAVAKEIAQICLDDIRAIASLIYEGNYWFETIAATWKIASNCAHQQEIEAAADAIKHNAKKQLTKENRFSVKTGMAKEDCCHIGIIYYTFVEFLNQNAYEKICQDVRYYRNRAPIISSIAQLTDILQDFELINAFHKKVSDENATVLVEKCRELELKIRNLVVTYRSEYEMVRKYYEALVRELNERVNKLHPSFRNCKFNKYLCGALLNAHLHKEQVNPLPTIGTKEPAKPLAHEEDSEVQVLSQRELNAQVNELMKQFESTTPASHTTEKCKSSHAKQQKIIDVYNETKEKPSIATMSKSSFGELGCLDKMLCLFEYQDYWFERILNEQDPSALMRFIQRIYSDHEKHKAAFDSLLNDEKPAEQNELIHLYNLVAHSIRCHNKRYTEQENKEQIAEIAKKYEADSIALDGEMHAIRNTFKTSSIPSQKIQIPAAVARTTTNICQKMHRKLKKQRKPLDIQACIALQPHDT